MGTVLPSEFLRAIEHDPRNCVLLVGAGLSTADVRKNGAGLPNWQGLVSSMVLELSKQQKVDTDTLEALKLKFESEDDQAAAQVYLEVAGLYKSKTRGDQFAEFLHEQLDPPDLVQSPIHDQILRSQFRGILTTNFDMVFESQSNFRLHPLVYPQSLADYYAFSRFGFFFKVHGCIRYTPNLYENLILTAEDFTRLSHDENYKQIIRSIFSNNPVLTVGYSLRDPDFLALLEDLRKIAGRFSPTVYALIKGPAPQYAENWRKNRDSWRSRGVELMPFAEYGELPTIFEQLAGKLRSYSPQVQPPQHEDGSKKGKQKQQLRGTIEERHFLKATVGPPLKLGQLDLQCKLFPESLWKASRPRPVYVDDPEAHSKISLKLRNVPLPKDTLATLIFEIEATLRDVIQGKLFLGPTKLNALKEVHQRLTLQGSNAYPRLLGIPKRIPQDRTSGETLQVSIGPSRFGVALIEERKLDLGTARQLREHYVLNSLAVRVALYWIHKGKKWVEFHQRKGGPNATYKDSWDVSAAGYVDPQRHKDPEDRNRVSPWQACAHELSEELGVPLFELPHRDNYFFLGVGRNEPTGQLDLLAFCEAASMPDPKRPTTARVRAFDRCVLDPDHISKFIESKQRWVPTALLTLILMLEALGSPRKQIERAFSPLAGRIDLRA